MATEPAGGPTPSTAQLAADYGLKADAALLPWQEIETRIVAAKTYWLSTVDPDGLPHTRPVDGIWEAGRLYFSGSRHSRWYKNVLANPQVCTNLEEGVRAVILHGAVTRGGVAEDVAERLAGLCQTKYDWSSVAVYLDESLLAFSPAKAFAWNLLYEDATRYEFA